MPNIAPYVTTLFDPPAERMKIPLRNKVKLKAQRRPTISAIGPLHVNHLELAWIFLGYYLAWAAQLDRPNKTTYQKSEPIRPPKLKAIFVIVISGIVHSLATEVNVTAMA